MDPKFGASLVVLIVMFGAINASPSNFTKTDSVTPSQNSSKEIAKSDAEDSSDLIIVPKTEIISKPSTTTTTTATNTTTTTTTTPAPTTPAPIPPPVPGDIGKWVVRNISNNAICIIVQMAMQINLTYPDVQNKEQNATIYIPAKNSSASGSCLNPESINITWGPEHFLKINFGMNSSAKNFFISSVILDVNATIFNNIKKNVSRIQYVSNATEFVTPIELSYKCSKSQSLNLSSSDPLQQLKAVLTVTNTQFEAYVNKTADKFSAAQDCDSFETPDVVPIAVGCALAILVLVVLVAYLIGRKHSQNRGYFSM